MIGYQLQSPRDGHQARHMPYCSNMTRCGSLPASNRNHLMLKRTFHETPTYIVYSWCHWSLQKYNSHHRTTIKYVTSDNFPTMHHFVTDMCTHAHFCYKSLHCGIWEQCIVGLVQKSHFCYKMVHCGTCKRYIVGFVPWPTMAGTIQIVANHQFKKIRQEYNSWHFGMTFWNAFCGMKIISWFRFQWNLFPRV